MTAPRVTITVGTRARFHLDVFVARPVCLAGVTLKFEATRDVAGEVVSIAVFEGPLLPGEKREHVFTVRVFGAGGTGAGGDASAVGLGDASSADESDGCAS